MPITSSTLAKRKKPCSFDYQGDEVNLEYFPAAIGPDTVKQLNAWVAKANAAESEDAAQAILLDFGAWVCTILASWDYLEDDGVTMQPITPENIAATVVRFPDFLICVLVAIVEDRNQGNANGTASPEPSDATSSKADSSTSSKTRSSQKKSA